MNRRLLYIAFAGLLLTGCGRSVSKSPKKALGGEGQPCFTDGTCSGELVCEQDRCAAVSVNSSPNMTPNNISPNVTPNNISPNVTPNNGVCGDFNLDPGELCDGDLNGQSCVRLGYAGGTLRCGADCTFDESGCATAGSCGNGLLDANEACDGPLLKGESCATLGFDRGELACAAACGDFDTTGCTIDPFCGDGVRNGAEQCEGADLGGQSCETLGAMGGTLRCDADCMFVTSDCRSCGNNVIEPGELCDGTSLGGETCFSLTGQQGTLLCSNSCTDYDDSRCGLPPVQCELHDNAAADCLNGGDLVACVCQPCVNDGMCEPVIGTPDDCVCADCQTSASCETCDNNGICNPWLERCDCADCANHPECAP